MQNIVMAAATGQPVADGFDCRSSAVDSGGGLFRELVARELMQNAAAGRAGGRRTALPCDPVLALLMSALMPAAAPPAQDPAVFQQVGAVAPLAGPGSQENTGQAVQAAPAAGDPGDSWKAADVPQAADSRVFAALQAFFQTFGMEIEAAEAAPSGPAATADGQAQPSPVPGLSVGAAAQQPVRLTEREQELFAAALETLSRAGEAAAPQTGGAEALGEIRRLFARMVGEERAANAGENPAQPEKVTQPLTGPVQPDLPVQNGPRAQAARTDGLAAAGSLRYGDEAPAANPAAPFPAAQVPQATGARQDHPAQAVPAAAPEAQPQPKQPHDSADAGPEHAAPLAPAWRPHEAAAPASAARPAQVRAAAAEEAFDSIVGSIRSFGDAARKEMEIQLKPSFLGKVVIRLSLDEGGLVARVAASNPTVQDAFLNQASTLQAALADQGLKDVRVVVTSSSVQDPGLRQQSDRRSQGQQERNRRGRAAVEAVQAQGAREISAYEAVFAAGFVNRLA